MKFLLTSNGLSNQSIAKALSELVGKAASETTITFIPTAMNVGSGNKDWFIDDLSNIKKQNLKKIDIVDISALPKDIWLPRLEEADVLFFSGGMTYHLMNWLKKSGLAELLPELLKTRVWAGISAGSIVTNPTLALSSKDKKIYYEETFGYNSEEALGFVDFYVRPLVQYLQHLNKTSKDLDGSYYSKKKRLVLEIQDQPFGFRYCYRCCLKSLALASLVIGPKTVCEES